MILPKISSAIQELDNQYEGKANVNFVSHSMGGALSSVMLAEIKADPDKYPFSKNIKTILTFVSLPPGDVEFERKYKEMCEKHQIECIDIVNRNDLSFLIPPQNSGVNRQVILSKDGTVIIDPSLTDKIGRMMDLGSPFAAHNEGNILAEIRKRALGQGITGGKDIPLDSGIGSSGSGNRTNNLQK